jgi:ribonuclease P protein component
VPRFSREDRLVSKQDFQTVFAKPDKISRKLLTVLYVKNSLLHARIGILISKQQVKQAVDRNRLRRIVRESFREHKNTLPALDMIVIVRSGIAQLSNQDCREYIDNLWLKLPLQPSLSS